MVNDITQYYINRTALITKNWKRPVPLKSCDGLISYSGCNSEQIESFLEIYATLNDGKPLGSHHIQRIMLYHEILCFIAIDTRVNDVIGISMHYFNQRDFDEDSIHLGYIGIMPNYRGQYIGYNLGTYYLKYYAQNTDVKDVSTRVSLNNTASLKCKMRQGFKINERYYDNTMHEERFYMMCPLSIYKNSSLTQASNN